MTTTGTRGTIDIETAGGTVKLNVEGRTTLSIAIRGDGNADYALEGREREGENWMATKTKFSSTSNYDDVIDVGWKQVRIRCDNGTGTSGDSATIVLSAGGK